MRGDGEDLQKDAVTERLFRASLKVPFQADITSIREWLKIPKNGLPQELIAGWHKRKNIDVGIEIEGEVRQLIQKHKLPLSAEHLLERYIISNSFLSPALPNYFDCDYEPLFSFDDVDQHDDSMEAKWNRAGRPYLRVYISEQVNLKQAQAFLKTHWKYFQKYVFDKKPGQKNIRRSRHSKRDMLIVSLYKLPAKQLELKRGVPREVRIATILNTQHAYKNVTPETVKSVVHRNKKLGDS